ncbi:hypothetical protein P9F85_04675 [Bacillus stercoris]|nr:hypothetical protein [Bacillus stercoris]
MNLTPIVTNIVDTILNLNGVLTFGTVLLMRDFPWDEVKAAIKQN